MYSRDAAGGREIDINFLLPFGELSSKPDGIREQGGSPSRMACFCEGRQSEERVGSHLDHLGPMGVNLQVGGTEVCTHVCLVLKPSSITLLWKGGLEFNISWQECIHLSSLKGLYCCSLLRQ